MILLILILLLLYLFYISYSLEKFGFYNPYVNQYNPNQYNLNLNQYKPNTIPKSYNDTLDNNQPYKMDTNTTIINQINNDKIFDNRINLKNVTYHLKELDISANSLDLLFKPSYNNLISTNKCCLVTKKFDKTGINYNYKKLENEQCDINLHELDNNNQLLLDGIDNWDNKYCVNDLSGQILGSCRKYNFECIDFITQDSCNTLNSKYTKHFLLLYGTLSKKINLKWFNKSCENKIPYKDIYQQLYETAISELIKISLPDYTNPYAELYNESVAELVKINNIDYKNLFDAAIAELVSANKLNYKLTAPIITNQINKMIENYMNKKIDNIYLANIDTDDIQRQNLIKQNIDINAINQINISDKSKLLTQLKEAEMIKQEASYKKTLTTKDIDTTSQAVELVNIKTRINNSMDEYYKTNNITRIKENTNLKAI